ncbi:MAG TPA: D-alanyl-D-alanine carboxypeptidase family protein [Gaiellaceae bacterium]|jgi:D-alanyl-D-alanine carboxypeptidase (penicillin-binding protein 5/6)|nr:D-alanyl-D-alanine carboxypeptidase family protein [Gaiellaceae bacterium]
MRRLAALVAALAFASPATAMAAPPPVHASAYIIEDARTGEVLASSHAREHLPIASLTKMMTVLLALEHHKLTDVVTVDRRASVVGESTIHLRAGEKLTVRDLIKGALIQSANDAAAALALSMAPDFPSFARLMNAKAAALGLHDTHFVRPDGLDVPDHYSSAADMTKLARILMRTRFVRDTVDEETATIAGGRTLYTWDDLLSMFPGTIGVKTGHTSEAGWCQVAAARGPGVTVYATLLGGPTRSVRNVDLESLLIWGLAQFRVVHVIQPERTYATVAVPYGKQPLGLVAAKPLTAVARLGRPLTEKVVAASAVSLPVKQGAVLGRVEVWEAGKLRGSSDLVASRTINKPGLGSRLGWYAGRTLHHLGGLF